MASSPIRKDALVLIGGQSGLTFIPTPTPLTRLHYFDGKFLRAEDLQLEQGALRQLVALANQAGGAGVVYGLDCTLQGGDELQLGPGFAVDGLGQALLLPRETSFSLADLIEASRRRLVPAAVGVQPADAGGFGDCELKSQPEAPTAAQGAELYVITVGHAEAYCGEEDVYGKLCEEACITSTDRPYIVEGITVRAVPLVLATPLRRSSAVALTQVHLRSLVASAYFADEPARVPDLISRDGLAAAVWCLGASPQGGGDVPVALVARAGDTTLFLDRWIPCRERMEAPPRQYWAWRMAMRPWSVFLAQVLQFQCQLRTLFQAAKAGGGAADPCQDVRLVARDASQAVAELMDFYGKVSERFATFRTLSPSSVAAADLPTFSGGLATLTSLKGRLEAAARPLLVLNRVLIRGGIVELPSFGYLPVDPASGATVNQQARQLLGEGLDLRFCVVRPDYVPHAMEEAQHLDRISLLQGLDDPRSKPQVDILVPDGQIVSRALQTQGMGFEGRFEVPLRQSQTDLTHGPTQEIQTGFPGAGRAEVLAAGGGAFHFAGALSADQGKTLVRAADTTGLINQATTARLGDILRAAAQPGETSTASGSTSSGKSAATATPGNAVAASLDRVGMVVVTPVGGYWTTLRCERNPFSLTPGDTTPAGLRQLVAVPAFQGLTNDLMVQGTLRVDEVSGTESDRVVVGHFSGVSVSRERRGGEIGPPDTMPLEAEARARLRRSADGAAQADLRLQVTDSAALVAQVKWQGKPLAVTATAELVVVKDGVAQRTPFASCQLKENAEVLSAGNEYHTLALWGLDVIGSSIQDPKFADASGRLLFPPLPPPTDELEVRATRDWVAFHRRRASTCAAEEVAPAPPPARRYQTYHLAVADQNAVQAVRSALVSNGDLSNFPLRPVDIVQFAPGVPALASDPAAVKADWRAAGPGTSLLYGGMASEAAAASEGDVVALGRLDRLETVIAEVTPLDPAASAEVLPRVPSALGVPGTDGAIVLLTRLAVQRTCQTAYWVESQQVFKRIVAQIQAGQIAQVLQSDTLRLLGNVTFRAGTSEVLDQSLDPVVSAWNGLGGGVPAGAAAVFRPDATAEDRTAQTEQATAIEKALGGGPTVGPISNQAELPGDCPSISFFVAAQPVPRVARMYVWAGRDNQQNRIIQEANTILQFRFNPDGTLLQPLTGGQLQVLKPLGPFFQVELASTEGANASGATARLKGITDQLKENGLLGSGAKTSVVTLSAAESGLFNRDGIVALDVVLLQRG